MLIDEIDRADSAFEAYLLELLSAFQITIPEIGTIGATHIPFVILTSNGTRELGDALRRRCLFYWMEYPSFEKEMEIVKKHLPAIGEKLANQVVHFVNNLRAQDLDKAPGIAETLDWAAALLALKKTDLDLETVNKTLGCVLKSESDLKKLDVPAIEAFILPT